MTAATHPGPPIWAGGNLATQDIRGETRVMNAVERFLPLSTPVLHILLALGPDRLHGLGILEAIAAKSKGRAVILPGTLYVTLNRMVDDGLIVEADRPEGADTRRKYYRTTGLGREVVAAEMKRMAVLMEVARQDLLPEG